MDTIRKNSPSILIGIAALVLMGPLSFVAQMIFGTGAAVLTGSTLVLVCIVAARYDTQSR